ncbi:unnamed protein product [Gongylonema pulchrum]|uniref:acid phosphatase n=1 Tax=Gongylonema pulchrum TaxID=637853 RepID=A0A183EBL0_9BILA|nr:unnamed protein product [Gongylonema pulchrum]
MIFLQLITITAFGIIVVLGADELLLLQVAWRHGDRAPLAICKGDTTKEKEWPQGLGELTARGMEQHVKLGKIIRERYVDKLKFLDGHYNTSQVFK